MVNGETARTGSSGNRALPVARLAGLVALVANLIIFVALIAGLLADSMSSGGAILVWLLAIVTFLLAAGLIRYAMDDGGSQLLAAFAAAYSLIASLLLVLTVLEPSEQSSSPVTDLVVLLLLAGTAIAMGVVVARIAGLPIRRLAIPLIIVALVLVLAATLVVLGVNFSFLYGDSRVATLGRLLVALVATAMAVAWLLAYSRSGSGALSARMPARFRSGSARN